jgi:hypothetical protein
MQNHEEGCERIFNRHWADADILYESSALGKIPVGRALPQQVSL